MDIKWLIISILIITLIQSAYGICITNSGVGSGGSFSETLNIIAPIDGSLSISDTIGNGVLMQHSGSGTGVPLDYSLSRTSSDGRSTATITADVTGAGCRWKYTDPGQQITSTSARLSNFKLSAAGADKITCTTEAARTGPSSYDVKGVMDVSDPNGHHASLTDFTSSAVANKNGGYVTQNGQVHGILDRSLGDSNTPELTAQSSGIVDAALNEMATVTAGKPIEFVTSGTFSVNQAGTANKIQDAVDAAFDGDKINVAAGTYKENIQIDKSLIIKGSGAKCTTVDGNQASSTFIIGQADPNVDVALSGMTIQNGTGVLTTVGPYNYLAGGGIWNAGTLELNGISILDNTAQFGGGIYNNGIVNMNQGSSIASNTAGNGGGIYNEGTLNLNNILITHNTASTDNNGNYGNGGGIASYGTVNMNRGSCITNNTAEIAGGGIASHGMVNMNQGSSIASNTADDHGGGIDNWYGTVKMNGGSITDNKAVFSGGGIANEGTVKMNGGSITDNKAIGFGGGIGNDGIVNMNGGSIAGNTADYGGGIDNNGGGTVNMNGGSITGNTANMKGGGINNDYTLGSGAGIVNMNGGSITGNTADYGGGIYNVGTATLLGGTIINNRVLGDGAGIYNYDGKLFIGGTTRITNNKATTGHGGGIYSNTTTSGSVTFDGTKVAIKSNMALLPYPLPTKSPWYDQYGVYMVDGIPSTQNGFNPATQVTGNKHI